MTAKLTFELAFECFASIRDVISELKLLQEVVHTGSISSSTLIENAACFTKGNKHGSNKWVGWE